MNQRSTIIMVVVVVRYILPNVPFYDVLLGMSTNL